MENRLEEASTMPPSDKIAHLWLGLRNMAWRISNTDQSPEVDSTFLDIQQELLATPGHAQYFADTLEEERLRSEPRLFRGNFIRYAYRYLNETLVHLPSPETVKVLGYYLNDERDKPTPRLVKTSSIPYPGTFTLAFKALYGMGLRDLPVTDMDVERFKPAPGEKWTDQQWLDEERRVTTAYARRQERSARQPPRLVGGGEIRQAHVFLRRTKRGIPLQAGRHLGHPHAGKSARRRAETVGVRDGEDGKAGKTTDSIRSDK